MPLWKRQEIQALLPGVSILLDERRPVREWASASSPADSTAVHGERTTCRVDPIDRFLPLDSRRVFESPMGTYCCTDLCNHP